MTDHRQPSVGGHGNNAPESSNEYWLDQDRSYRIQSRHTYPICLARGQGVRLWDVTGKAYLDFEAGQICTSTGHCHPDYVAAVTEQLKSLIQTGSAYVATTQIEFQKKLAEIMPAPFRKSFLVCSGTESNEAAMRLAKAYTGRYEIVSFMGNYHGKTQGSWSVTGFGNAGRAPYGPGLPGSVFLPTPYSYPVPNRPRHPGRDDGVIDACIEFCEQMLSASTSGRPAAFMVELVQSAAGVQPLPRRFLEWIRRTCDERGALMIADEAQTGMGRLGRYWWGYEHFGVRPDVITASKTLGGGLPLSAVITSAEIADAAVERGYRQSSSHTGDPLLAAAGLANIGIIERDNLLENVAELGAYLKRQLEAMASRSPVLDEIRGLGFILGMEFVRSKATGEPNEEATQAFTERCRERGLLTGWWKDSNLASNIVRLMPPYNLTREEADEALSIIEDTLQEVGSLGAA